MTGRWLGKAAVLWALDEAEVPARLVSTLIAVARYAGEDGHDAHPSAATIALHTRKSLRQAQRDLADLEKAGLLWRGDQRKVLHISADKRPVVYDLPLSDTTPMTYRDTTPMTGRYDTQSPNGASPTSYKESPKGSRKSARQTAAAPRATQTPPPPSQMCIRCGGYGHTQAECWR